jgi:hypothetical protein
MKDMIADKSILDGKIRLQGKTQELNLRDKYSHKKESDLKLFKPPVDRR